MENKSPKLQNHVKNTNQYHKLNLDSMIIETFGKNRSIKCNGKVVKVEKKIKIGDTATVEGFEIQGDRAKFRATN